ncbi:hypothetical protein RB195_005352 [Necator americanus]|uniref:Uncharacterized protein n=2 Tax=Necator americanus TaxID=51031 RepID=A0ABR1BMD6_NECAM|nr:hypothetical protein NECAME_00947 [Necator americanus]ETN70001.1 hypothetical protein NECAME_00947 [Necator americanus]
MNFTTLLALLLSLLAVGAFNVDFPQYYGGYGQIRRDGEEQYAKRAMPMKFRRSPLEGFEEFSSMMRSIDGIQKPRFG